MTSQVFRAGVVLVVRRENGDLLAFERADVPGAWQLPQGGLDADEEPVAAAWRELEEETGLRRTDVRLVVELPEWIAYEWPDEIRSRVKDGRHRRGQIQKWFLFGVPEGCDVEPRPDGVEFSGWKWMSPQQIMDGLPPFRRDCYGRAFARILP
ncbi:MAG: NUDIX domain-containing protein [Ilumatobacteraceae bacterium]